MFTINRVDAPISDLSKPDAPLWEQAQGLKVPLIPAPVAMQPSVYVRSKWRDGQYGQLPELRFQALHNGVDLAIRLVWEAASLSQSRQDAPADNDFFPDSAALLFPMHPDAPIFMGLPGAPVCIWHWKANAEKRAAINTAEGIGSSRVLPATDVTADSLWADGYWQLVFSRRLVPEALPDAQPHFSTDGEIRTAFAVWDGLRQERAGMKAFSPNWTNCRLEP